MKNSKKNEKIAKSEEIDAAMKDAAPCPFCGTNQGMTPEIRFVRVEVRHHGDKWFHVSCWLCGAKSAEQPDPLEAIKSWNQRPSKAWTPLGPKTFILPGQQKYGHLMVQETANEISLIDYIEEEISPEKDGIQGKIDLKLGRFRLCEYR